MTTPQADVVARIADVLSAHAGCTMNDGAYDEAATTAVGVWSCGIRVPFSEQLEDAERRHLAEAVAAVVTPPAAVDEAVRDFILNARTALRAATTIGERSCRDGDNLNYGNHDRLIAEATRLLAAASSAAPADRCRCTPNEMHGGHRGDCPERIKVITTAPAPADRAEGP